MTIQAIVGNQQLASNLTVNLWKKTQINQNEMLSVGSLLYNNHNARCSDKTSEANKIRQGNSCLVY